jgi:SAM-dependent methyltransferase
VRRRPLKVVLVHGTSGAGKSFATERLLGAEYDVTTTKMDHLYYPSLRHAGVPSRSIADGLYSVAKEAERLRNGEHDRRTVEAFKEKLSELVEERAAEAAVWGVALVLEGYTLKFADETELVRDAARRVTAGSAEVFRVHLTPSLADWNRNRSHRVRLGGRRRSERERARKMAPPEPVAGVADFAAADLDEFRALVDERIGLGRYKWYQSAKIGPIASKGPSDAAEKIDAVDAADISGKRLLDLCCASGVHALVARDRGAAEVVGVERNPRHYAKALELTKLLGLRSGLNPTVHFHLGDAIETLPTLGRFDTVLLFGAIHYFPDYEAVLGSIAAATSEAAYVEFTFSEAGNDTATDPGAIRPWTRESGSTIFMGDPETIERTVARVVPRLEIEARTPISAPGRALASAREIWRLRRI